MYGRRRPHLCRVLSENQPMMGSVMTSNDRANAVKKAIKATSAPILLKKSVPWMPMRRVREVRENCGSA